MSTPELEIEMDCSVCGRYSTAALCPACRDVKPETMPDPEPMPDPTQFADELLQGIARGLQEIATGGQTTAQPEQPTVWGVPDKSAILADLDLTEDLQAIASGSRANASVTGIGSMAGGQLGVAGFTSRDGYVQALRNGVPEITYQGYLQTLRAAYGMTSADIAALNLPPPMTITPLPVGAGITHTPTGPSVFDRPRSERAFVVGPKEAPVERLDVTIGSEELVAGAVAEGHHAIVAWEGTSGLTRGELVAALTGIERADWAPKAPNARAQAGSAIAALSRQGLAVKPLVKGSEASGLASGEHVWTVGRVRHTGSVGEAYGEVVVRFRLTGATLSYTGDASLAEPVIAAFSARMSSEIFKSSDVTGWLSRVIRWRLDGVRFGALGWLVPAKHVDEAKRLCEAVRGAGFGAGWVTGLPVATSDQLRDGIANGLIEEVLETHDRIIAERRAAHEAQVAAYNAAAEISHRGGDNTEAMDKARAMPGDIGKTRAESMLKELRAIGGRIVAYGAVIGEARLERAQRTVRDAISELEGIAGDDFSGISARFSAVWDEIELDRKRSGGVL